MRKLNGNSSENAKYRAVGEERFFDVGYKMGWEAGIAHYGTFDEAPELLSVRRHVHRVLASSSLLDIARVVVLVVAGTLRLDLTRADIVQVVDRGVEAIRPVADRKRLRMSVNIDEGLPPLAGDPDRLQQVLGNILSNAVKFTPEDGQISVRASRHSSSVTITVSDTGVGIAPEFLPHVFDRFRQGQEGRTRSHGGLGIGLSLARKLVELHGGTIDARSDGKDKGATFVMRLPIRAVALPNDGKADAPAVSTAAASLSNLRVLIVDDEADARDLVREVLESSGADVLAADSAAEAVAAMASWRPDVIISDVGMPGRDGYSLLREIRAFADASLRDVPAIALTAYASHDEAERARTAGFQVHLAKPVEPAHLVAAVASLFSPRPVRSIASGS
jgi:CheY-like chemotaxis protein/two-component sensor histidine kinase